MIIKTIKITFLMWLIFSCKSYGQYDFVVDSLFKEPNKIAMQQLTGNFVQKNTLEYKSPTNIEKVRVYYFNNKKIKLEYRQTSKDGKCDELVFFNKSYSMSHFFGNLACNIDVTSFEAYEFDFANRKYFLLQTNNNGSGSATSLFFFNLFDITDLKHILYFPLWSYYGSPSCFCDYNHDNILDFLKIQNNWRVTGKNTYRVSLLSLDGKRIKFISQVPDNYIIFKKSYSLQDKLTITILKKCIQQQ